MSGTSRPGGRRDQELLGPPVAARRPPAPHPVDPEGPAAAPRRDDGLVLRLPVRRIERGLLAAVGALMAAYAVTEALRVAGYPTSLGAVNLFDVDSELSIPTWFASVLLLLAAVVAALIAAVPAERAERRPWLVVAAVALAISVDESAAFHESWTERVSQIVDVGGPLLFAWVIPASAILVLLGVAAVPFVRRLPRSTRRRLVAGAAVFVAGGLGMEMVGGWYHDSAGGGDDAVYGVIVGVEEALEMLGAVLVIGALLRHLRARTDAVHLELRD